MIRAHLLRWRPRPPCRATREIVEPRRGALPAPQEASAFGAVMAALINDPQQRLVMAREAEGFVREWTTEVCATRMAEVYRTVRQHHRAAN